MEKIKEALLWIITFNLLLFVDRGLTIYALKNGFVEENKNFIVFEVMLYVLFSVVVLFDFWRYEKYKQVVLYSWIVIYSCLILILFAKVIYNV